MGQTEIKLFIILMTIVVLIFIIGIVMFAFQYRKRKIIYENERAATERHHKLEMLHNKVKIQQQTMEFIGKEIHDSVAQKLTLATLYARKLEFDKKYPEIQEQLCSINEIINTSLTELRDLSRALNNSNEPDASLNDLIEKEKKRVDDAGVCRLEYTSDFIRPISFKTRNTLLRVLQEFIQNSIRHSGCILIKIAIVDTKEGLSVIISDDGSGFDMECLQSGGIGLNNMKLRILQVSGSYDLYSKPGAGTRLKLFIDNKNLIAV